MSVRAGMRLLLVGAIFAALAAPASGHARSHPQLGRYKATTSVGTSFEFRVLKATCPPPVRGGNQHQKKGFCLLPITEPTFDYTCPSGFTIHGEIYALFEELLSASGKLSVPETSSSGTTGTFHISIDRRGHASGFFEIVALHAIEGSETPERCPTGRMTFSARRV